MAVWGRGDVKEEGWCQGIVQASGVPRKKQPALPARCISCLGSKLQQLEAIGLQPGQNLLALS